MGKGKGSFDRKLIKIRTNQNIAEFSGININKLKKFIKKLNKKLNINLFIINKFKVYKFI